MRRLKVRYAAVAVVALTVIVEAIIVARSATGVLLLGIAAWFALSGVALVYRACGSSADAVGTAWLVGPAIGFGLGVAALLVLWTAGVQGWWGLAAAPVLILALAWSLPLLGTTRLYLPPLSAADVVPVVCALALVPIITLAPYARVRARVPEGEAYRAYFTADFIWAMSVSSEIAKGDVPPDNPFRHGEPLRYYWMAHMLSGAIYRNVSARGIAIEPVILINGLSFGLAFVAFVYWLARAVGATPAWALGAVGAGFVANSYEGFDMLRAIVAHHDAWEILRDTNIDAVTRWFYKGMAVDGLHRLLLYQPHHLTGYALSLAALWVVTLAADVSAVSVALWTGILLALGLLFSTFTAVIVSVATALVYSVRLVQQHKLKWVVQCGILAGGPLAIGVALTRVLGYTNPADGLLMTFGVNPVAIHEWWWVLFLSFGPLLLIGLPSVLRPHWIRGAGSAPAALVAVAFAFYVFIDVPDMGGVWVGWRTGHLLLIAFAAASAAGLTALWAYAESKAAVAIVATVAVILALPTVAIDVFNAQDIENHADAAGFPWTLVITPAEREAFDWIRHNTAPTSVIQMEPYVRNAATWAYVPAFAERRMAAGLPISMIPQYRYAQMSDNVRLGIFKADSADDAYNWAEWLHVDYVLVGDRERQAYRVQVDRMRERPELFRTVFHNDAILLLQVVHTGNVAARHR